MKKPTKLELTANETNLLIFTRTHQQAIFSGLISTMAMERNHQVTENTKFTLNDELTELTLEEIEPKKEPTKDSVIVEGK